MSRSHAVAAPASVFLALTTRLATTRQSSPSRVRIVRVKDLPTCPPHLRIFSGKPVRGVLAGHAVNPLYLTKAQLEQVWADQGILVLLPGGGDLMFGDSGFRSAELRRGVR